MTTLPVPETMLPLKVEVTPLAVVMLIVFVPMVMLLPAVPASPAMLLAPAKRFTVPPV